MFKRFHTSWLLRATLKWFLFLSGLFLLAVGSSIMITANLGVSTWDVLHLGLQNKTPLSVGTVILLVGLLLVLVKYLLDRIRPQVGTLVNAIFVGVFMNLVLGSHLLPSFSAVWLNAVWLIFGIFIIGMGAGLYVAVGYGAGPRDGLTLTLADRFGTSIRMMRTIMEITACGLGWLLGGPVFFGTILSIFLIGPFLQFWLVYFRRMIAAIDAGVVRPNEQKIS
ncbi:membrane protein [Exiguobacterium sp. N4-1P]|uniref:YczE/YyaS/YitT family protein n=1 Tax=unclassified Exiguobacterium TaxID=2644629 RepID=UPI000B58E4E3|nr:MULTISPECIES: membrane protein [unclassified Exiguobacterium]ASI36747.1 membrane protein [Exiguobacterium sp. N4-1P]